MFKVGDKVRCIDADMDLTDGKIYRIEGVFNDPDKFLKNMGEPYVIDDVGDKRNALCGCFEIGSAGPVREVTTRQVIPGTYGKVRVTEGGYVHCKSMRTAEEIRDTIATLEQIAEAMEG